MAEQKSAPIIIPAKMRVVPKSVSTSSTTPRKAPALYITKRVCHDHGYISRKEDCISKNLKIRRQAISDAPSNSQRIIVKRQEKGKHNTLKSNVTMKDFHRTAIHNQFSNDNKKSSVTPLIVARGQLSSPDSLKRKIGARKGKFTGPHTEHPYMSQRESVAKAEKKKKTKGGLHDANSSETKPEVNVKVEGAGKEDTKAGKVNPHADHPYMKIKGRKAVFDCTDVDAEAEHEGISVVVEPDHNYRLQPPAEQEDDSKSEKLFKYNPAAESRIRFKFLKMFEHARPVDEQLLLFAYRVYNMSHSVYRFLRRNYLPLLPSRRTLQRYFSIRSVPKIPHDFGSMTETPDATQPEKTVKKKLRRIISGNSPRKITPIKKRKVKQSSIIIDDMHASMPSIGESFSLYPSTSADTVSSESARTNEKKQNPQRRKRKAASSPTKQVPKPNTCHYWTDCD